MHLTEGQLRAYLDQALASQEQAAAGRHLQACSTCAQRLEQMAERGRQVSEHLSRLAPSTPLPPLPAAAARARLQRRISEKENTPMFNKLFARSYRPAWFIVAVVAVLALALAFQPVRAIANSFLGLFRVQQVSVVPVNPGDMPQQLGRSSQFEALISKDVQFEENGKSQEVASAADASQQAGFNVRLPSEEPAPTKINVEPGGKAVLKVDRQHVNAVLDEIGRQDLRLPAGLDGATVTLEVPTAVTAMYGDCQFDTEAARKGGYDPDSQETPRLPNCTTLIQMPSPTIQAPPGIDLAQIGEIYLQVMGMSAEDARHFAANVDWTTTLVVPVPRYGTSYEDVSVDGVTGTLIQRSVGSTAQYMLVWVKDGILYALTGPGEGPQAQALGNSLK
jgi:hypothetical protein